MRRPFGDFAAFWVTVGSLTNSWKINQKTSQCDFEVHPWMLTSILYDWFHSLYCEQGILFYKVTFWPFHFRMVQSRWLLITLYWLLLLSLLLRNEHLLQCWVSVSFDQCSHQQLQHYIKEYKVTFCMIYHDPKFPLDLSIDDLIPSHCSLDLSRRYFISTQVIYRPPETSHHML